MSALEVRNLSFAYPGADPLFESAEFTIPKGALTVLVGPNGVGKSTLFDLLVGFEQSQAGDIRFFGEQVAGSWVRPFQVAAIRPRVVRSFQVPRVVAELSVLDNVLIGQSPGRFRRWITQFIVPANGTVNEQEAMHVALQTLSRFGLEGKAAEQAGTLSYGELRLLELARIFDLNPGLVLLDEPFANLNRAMTAVLAGYLAEFVNGGGTAMVIEHGYEKHLPKVDLLLDVRGRKVTARRR